MNNEPMPLIVVDMQNGFLRSKSMHVIGPVRTLVDRWVEMAWPIYFTKFVNLAGSQWEEWLDWHRLMGSPDTDLAPEFGDAPKLGTVMEKALYTAVTGVLAEALEREAWTAAVLCGVATDGCVMETAVDLFQRRVRPLVITDACASHAGNEVHEMGLHLLKRSIGEKQLLNTDELFKLLLKWKA